MKTTLFIAFLRIASPYKQHTFVWRVMSDVVFDHRVLITVEVLVAWWIATRVVRSTWFHAGLVGVAPPALVHMVWWRCGTRPSDVEAVRRLALYAVAGVGAALCYRSTRTIASVPHAVFALTLAAHLACIESSETLTHDQGLLIAVLAVWCAREFQARAVAAGLCVVPLAATALWRTYGDSAMRAHHVALMSELGFMGWNATSASVALRGRQWIQHATKLASLPHLDH